MDWSYYVESIWRASVPLELVPDLAAWGVCSGAALWVVRFVAVWRPRTCVAGALAWFGWLGWQVGFLSGYSALEAAQSRFAAALEATDQFAQVFLALVRAWADFFLPFLSDVCRWVLSVWRRLSVRQRLVLIGTVLSTYAIVESIRMFRKHKSFVKKVLFHASFLLGGPLIWHLCGIMPVDWLPSCLSHAITTAPAVLSLLVLCDTKDAQQASTRRPWAGPGAGAAAPASVAMQRLWLNYWACWPALALLEAAVGMVPRLLPYFTLQRHLHADLQRALLAFIVWLQYWQGSRLLNFTLRSVISHTTLLERLAQMFGHRGLQVLSVVRGGLTVTGSSSAGGVRLIARLSRRLWLFVLLCLLGTVVAAVLVYVFFSAVSVISSLATAMLWCFAAADAADTLTHRAEDFYARKLAFWVLAMMWDALTQLPYIGVVLRLFTPFAFSLWLVAGETVLRYLILPLLLQAKAALLAVGAGVRSAGKASDEAEEQDTASEAEAEPSDGEAEPAAEPPGQGCGAEAAESYEGVAEIGATDAEDLFGTSGGQHGEDGASGGLPEGPAAACEGDTGGAGGAEGGAEDTGGLLGVDDTGGAGGLQDPGSFGVAGTGGAGGDGDGTAATDNLQHATCKDDNPSRDTAGTGGDRGPCGIIPSCGGSGDAPPSCSNAVPSSGGSGDGVPSTSGTQPEPQQQGPAAPATVAAALPEAGAAVPGKVLATDALAAELPADAGAAAGLAAAAASDAQGAAAPAAPALGSAAERRRKKVKGRR